MTGEVVQVTFAPGRLDGQLFLWVSQPGSPSLALLTPAAVTVDGMRATGGEVVAALHGCRCRVTLGRFEESTAAYHSAAVERLGR